MKSTRARKILESMNRLKSIKEEMETGVEAFYVVDKDGKVCAGPFPTQAEADGIRASDYPEDEAKFGKTDETGAFIAL